MRLFGFELTRAAPQGDSKAMSAVYGNGGGWFSIIREGFAGAWQSLVTSDRPQNILAFSAVFACVTIIASDIAKLCIDLVNEGSNGICARAPAASPFWQVLRKPNRFQNRIQFIENWIISKLLYGNTYVLKERDGRGVVGALYVLDPQRVTPLVSDSGDVYYQLAADVLAGITETKTFPAREIIHDRMNCIWHPLVGISPIYACGLSATMGNRIQANSTRFFQNMSRPSGQLTAAGTIDDVTAARLKASFEESQQGGNIGRLFVAGDGLKYESMSMAAIDAQLIEQLKWTVEDVARCFHVPLFKIGAETGRAAGTLSIQALNQGYYTDCLQAPIEALELCLDEGLALPPGYHAEVDTEGLLRMDTSARYEAKSAAVKGGWMSPNEARQGEDLPPVAGGDTPYLQQQNFSLAALAKRDALADPFSRSAPSATPLEESPAPDKAFVDDSLIALRALCKQCPLPCLARGVALV